jgi:serine phosphatase RsbU (regulator of sigma subunit)
MGVALIAPVDGTLVYAGVGNVEARLISANRAVRLQSARGIVGAVFPTVQPVEASLDPGWLLVIHSDGVSSKLDLDEEAGAKAADPQLLANRILARWSRAADDATVVVACQRPI